jgi:hypothetical protein
VEVRATVFEKAHGLAIESDALDLQARKKPLSGFAGGLQQQQFGTF